MTIGSTGPKISSFMIRISCVTSGEHDRGDEAALALAIALSPSVGPPVSLVAPAATASSTSSLTIAACSAETIGPISVFHSSGSPTVSRSVSRTTPCDELVGDLAR